MKKSLALFSLFIAVAVVSVSAPEAGFYLIFAAFGLGLAGIMAVLNRLDRDKPAYVKRADGLPDDSLVTQSKQ